MRCVSLRMIFLSQEQRYLQCRRCRHRWTSPNPPSPTRSLRSVLCPGVEVVVEVVAEGVEEEEVAEIKTIAVNLINPQRRRLRVRSTRAISTPTYRLETGRGALCTSAGAGELSSVVNRRLVLGRMSTLPSLPNETGTSSDLILKQVTI